MKEQVICKSCGFVMAVADLKERCPACGVPSRMFEPWKDPLSPSRRLLLTLDIHPVLAHFPQAFTFSILLLCLILRFLPDLWMAKAGACLEILCLALPLTVILTFTGGLIDGKVRFRKVATPLLRRKMALGSLLFLLSVTAAWLAASFSPLTGFRLNQLTAVAVLAMVCSAMLGWWGTKLLNAKFPG